MPLEPGREEGSLNSVTGEAPLGLWIGCSFPSLKDFEN